MRRPKEGEREEREREKEKSDRVDVSAGFLWR